MIKNWIDKYFPNKILVNEIGLVIKISIVPFEISSEKVLMQMEGIIIKSIQGDSSKKEFISMKLDFIIL